MGVLLMSKRELNRIDILARLDGGRLTTSAAADLMHLTTRQTHRLLKHYREFALPMPGGSCVNGYCRFGVGDRWQKESEARS